MTEQRDEEKSGQHGGEVDLRSIMGGRPAAAPPRRDDAPQAEARGYRSEDQAEASEPEPVKLPPVWPGDEKQEWFRKERGLPPLPEHERRDPTVLPEDLPSELAPTGVRAQAWLISVALPNLIYLIPAVGFAFTLVLSIINLFLYRQGQDIGAVVFRLRVVRDNGDVAGFFHMWTRSFAAIISLLALGAGYWTAFSDPEKRTWHDKWMRTYVVKDAPEYAERKRSSSKTAFRWFVVILVLIVLLPFFIVPPAAE